MRSAAYSSCLCLLSFVSFWNRIQVAGISLIILAIVIAGLGFGHMMNSPCPLSDLQNPDLPPDQS